MVEGLVEVGPPLVPPLLEPGLAVVEEVDGPEFARLALVVDEDEGVVEAETQGGNAWSRARAWRGRRSSLGARS